MRCLYQLGQIHIENADDTVNEWIYFTPCVNMNTA